MIEAKKLGGDLDGARENGFRYCWQNQVPHFLVTGGNHWKLFNIREMAGREVFSAQIQTKAEGTVARKLLALWRPAMPAISIAPEPLLRTQTAGPPPAQQPTPPHPISVSGRTAFSDIQPREVEGTRAPERVVLPDSTVIESRNWRELLVKAAQWALSHFRERNALPFHNFIVREHGRMRTPREIGNGWYIEVNLNARTKVERCAQILEAAGVSPSTVIVEGWDPQRVRATRSSRRSTR